MNSISIKVIDDFSNFTLVNDNEFISSNNFNHNITVS